MAYKIEQVLNDVSGKFVAMVSFNGRPAERYEVDSLNAKTVDDVLSKIDSEVVVLASKPAEAVPSVDAKGQIVVPVEKTVADLIV